MYLIPEEVWSPNTYQDKNEDTIYQPSVPPKFQREGQYSRASVVASHNYTHTHDFPLGQAIQQRPQRIYNKPYISHELVNSG